MSQSTNLALPYILASQSQKHITANEGLSMQGRIGRAGGAKMKRALGVQAGLERAFLVEKAQLELSTPMSACSAGMPPCSPPGAAA
jgi:hypothetical protein